jgi:glycosyltransferase involved in cell wall biosynthesis
MAPRQALARLAVAGLYAGALLVCALRGRGRRQRRRNGRIAIAGTFFNTQWFVSHATPLARAGIGEVLVVADAAPSSVSGVRFACPPAWLARLVGRAAAKFLWMVRVGLKERPDAYMGYHVMPNSLSALVVARLFGSIACYQMTGGPIEVVGGGYACDNALLRRVGGHSRLLERLALAVVRQFDFVAVRGRSARGYLLEQGVTAPVEIIPGSVDPVRFAPRDDRPYDLIFVGRLIPTKQPDQFVRVVAELARRRPALRALVVGDGELMPELRELAAALGVEDHVVFAGKQDSSEAFLPTARVFMLPSRTEGLSIALAEAMMAGAVPVVADVGDLADLVRTGETGYLVPPNDHEAYVRSVALVLDDPDRWQRLSAAAVAAARAHVSLEAVTRRWAECLDRLLPQETPLGSQEGWAPRT